MKTLIISIVFAVISISAYPQSSKRYYSVDPDFILTYPKEYVEMPIENAPHALLKLGSNNAMFILSYWNYGIDPDIDAWNDELYNGNKMKYERLLGNNLVLISRIILRIEGRDIRALRIIYNEDVYVEQLKRSITKYNVITQFFHKGNLYQGFYSNLGKYTVSSPIGTDILKGLNIISIE